MMKFKAVLLAGTFVPAVLAMQMNAFAGQAPDGSFRVAQAEPKKELPPPGAPKHGKPLETPQTHVAKPTSLAQDVPVKKLPPDVRPAPNAEAKKPPVEPTASVVAKKHLDQTRPVQNGQAQKLPVPGKPTQGDDIVAQAEPKKELLPPGAPKHGKPLDTPQIHGVKPAPLAQDVPVKKVPPDIRPVPNAEAKKPPVEPTAPVVAKKPLDQTRPVQNDQAQKLPVPGQPTQGADLKKLPDQGHPVQNTPAQTLPNTLPPKLGANGKPLPDQGRPVQNGNAQLPPPANGQPPQAAGNDHKGRDRVLTAAAIGAAAGFFGGLVAASTNAQNLNEIRQDRRVYRENGVEFVREPGRTIIDDGDRTFIIHDENERYRALGLDVQTQRRGDGIYSIINRPDGVQIITVTDPDGRLIRRVRRFPDGREFVLINNDIGDRPGSFAEDVIVLPPPPLMIPREQFIVDAADATPGLLYETLSAPPVAPVQRRYTLDQIRYSPDLRARMRSVDIDTINFDTGSWAVTDDQAQKLSSISAALKKAIARNANEVFLVEGYTDATGKPTSNVSLSDRRAQSVAEILTRDFSVPPENLTTQGYGQQNLKEPTLGPSRINRRVTLRRITPLLAAQGTPAAEGSDQ